MVVQVVVNEERRAPIRAVHGADEHGRGSAEVSIYRTASWPLNPAQRCACLWAPGSNRFTAGGSVDGAHTVTRALSQTRLWM